MKRVVMTVAALAAAGLAWAQQAPVRLDLPEFQKLVAANRVLVVDVRDPQSFAAGHIPGAINVMVGEERQHLGRLRAAKRPIVTYCA